RYLRQPVQPVSRFPQKMRTKPPELVQSAPDSGPLLVYRKEWRRCRYQRPDRQQPMPRSKCVTSGVLSVLQLLRFLWDAQSWKSTFKKLKPRAWGRQLLDYSGKRARMERLRV